LSRKLLELVAGAEYAPIVGVDVPVLDSAHKRVMHETLGAVGVDMESHMVAEFATANGMAFAAMRVVIDPVHRSVPFAAMSGMRPDGGTDASAVLRELVRSPRWVPSIARLAVDALAARNALVRTRRLLGPGLGVLPQPRGENCSDRSISALPSAQPEFVEYPSD
jgi:hypothetical protein